jgi:hypothetical protein
MSSQGLSEENSGKSSQRGIGKRFSHFLNLKDLKDIHDYSSSTSQLIKSVKTPKERKIIFTKEQSQIKIRRSFFDDFVCKQTEEDKQW